MSCFRTGGPGKEHGTNKPPSTGRVQERSKWDTTCPTTPRILLSSIHLGWTRHAPPGRTLESEWLAKDNPETNPIPIKPETSSHVTELFSWVPLPCCSPPRCSFPIKSPALSIHMSPRTIHFQVLDKSPVSGPGRGPPSCNSTFPLGLVTVTDHAVFVKSITQPTPPSTLSSLVCCPGTQPWRAQIVLRWQWFGSTFFNYFFLCLHLPIKLQQLPANCFIVFNNILGMNCLTGQWNLSCIERIAPKITVGGLFWPKEYSLQLSLSLVLPGKQLANGFACIPSESNNLIKCLLPQLLLVLRTPQGLNFFTLFCKWSQISLVVKNTPTNTGDMIPGWGKSPGGGLGNLLQYSSLENPIDRGAWLAIAHGVAESDTTEAT